MAVEQPFSDRLRLPTFKAPLGPFYTPGGQLNDEFGPLAKGALNAQFPAMPLRHVLHNGQSQACTTQISTPGFICSVKSFKQAGKMFGMNSRSIVYHLDNDMTVFFIKLNVYSTFIITILLYRLIKCYLFILNFF